MGYSLRALCKYLRVWRKNPTSDWWNNQTKGTVEKKESSGCGDGNGDVVERCIFPSKRTRRNSLDGRLVRM